MITLQPVIMLLAGDDREILIERLGAVLHDSQVVRDRRAILMALLVDVTTEELEALYRAVPRLRRVP